MFRNYCKVALRNILRQKLYSSINVAGLSIGIACSILIFLWVQDEYSYDGWVPRADRLYRLNWDFRWNGNEGVGPGTPPPLAAKLTGDIPEVAAATRLRPMLKTVVRCGDRFFNEGGILAADSNFLELFPFAMTEGNPETVLREPGSVVLTESTARKYFGSGSPVGRSLLIGENGKNMYGTYQNLFTVTGVVRDVPANSHIQFDMLTSMASYPEVAWRNWSWVWMQVTTYVQLKEGVAPGVVQERMPGLVNRYVPAGFKRLGMSYDEMIAGGGHWNFVLQPLPDIYLGSVSIGNRLGPLGDRTQVYLFSLVALFMLVIAGINFMTLSTARSGGRAREIGVRKVLGCSRSMLVGQFLTESVIYSFIALIVGVVLVEVFLPSFNDLAGKTLSFSLVRPVWVPGALIALGVIVGVFSGSYPGFYLSSLRPAAVMKGGSGAPKRGPGVRNALVITQFAITIGLITCTLLVRKQMEFIRQTDLGFNEKDAIVISNENNILGNRAETFRDRLKAHSRVVDASLSTGVPPLDTFEDSYEVGGKEERQFSLSSYIADDNFLSTLGLRLVSGRTFAKGRADSASVILNEAAVKYLGFADPLGRVITYQSNRVHYTVIGVVRDFNFLTLYSPITPFALFHESSRAYAVPNSFVIVRGRPGELRETVAVLESEWRAAAPAVPFEYTFLDNSVRSGYRSAEQLGDIFLVFSLLTIFVACLGLFALSSFATEQRTKEIGIRKVLGASVGEIVALLSRELAWLILVANLIAWPAAYYAMHQWLQMFAYRADISWWLFVLAGSLALVVAFITVGWQSVRAATADPVKSLRYE